MRRFACGMWAVVALAMLIGIGSVQGAIMPDGREGTEENSEYLFGASATILSTQLVLTLDAGGPLTIAAGDQQGWWSDTQSHANDASTNFVVGDLSNNLTMLYNNFFSFNVSSVDTATVTAAELQVQRFTGGTSTSKTKHTYSLYDVHTASATLNNNVGTSAAIFDDLGTGVNYGNYQVTVAGSSSEILPFALNANAVADINYTNINNIDGRVFSIGGTLYPIPEPTTFVVWSLLAALGIATGWWRNRKRNA